MTRRTLRREAYHGSPAGLVLANRQQVGPDHLIEMNGVEGLYPDDVYKLILR